jgi:ubiquitin-conjugating enzyme E2 N
MPETMEPTRDFSLTENEIHNLQQSIEQARAIVKREIAQHPSVPFNRRPHTTRRLGAELSNLSRSAREPANQGSSDFPFSIMPLHDSVREFIGKFPGPSSTPYEGGIFHVRLSVPDGYPEKPPRVWFCTKTYHPNVHQTGEVCSHGLSVDWNAAWCLRTAVLAVASLLSAPDLSDPLVPEVAREFLTDHAAFQKTAREWTVMYAVEDLFFPGQRADGFCNTTTGQL